MFLQTLDLGMAERLFYILELAFGRAPEAAGAGPQQKKLFDGERVRVVEVKALGDIADARHLMPDYPALIRDGAQKSPEQRRLARAVGTDDGHHVAEVDFKRQLLEHGILAQRYAQVLDFKQWNLFMVLVGHSNLPL